MRGHNEGIRFANQCVVHQIMSPLKMIYEYVDILLYKMEGVSPESLIFLQAIKSCSYKIQFNIHDLEAASQLVLEPIKIKKQQVYPTCLIEDTLFMYNLQIDMQDLKVIVDIDPSVPKLIESDPVRFQQVLSNMMSNATKFANNFSEIEIKCTYDNDKELLMVSITNEGVIIQDKEVHDLFKRYKTLKSAQMTGAAGSGLGLYICKSLCQAMGGDIVLEKRVSKNDDVEVGINTFVASIKAKRLEEDKTFFQLLEALNVKQIEFDTIEQTKILIFEDEAYSLLSLKELMHNGFKLKQHTEFYNTGTAIANTIKQLYDEKGTNQVAIVIIDYNMQGMNGIELINWVHGFFKTHDVPPENTPKFAFRAQQFYALPIETIQ
jgi:CheY-like chemotaxis protein